MTKVLHAGGGVGYLRILAEACRRHPDRFSGLTAVAPQDPATLPAPRTGRLLRLITGGVFDRFPRLKIVIGHAGESLPYWLYRFDYMHAADVRSGRYQSMQPTNRKPSDYLRENVWVTTSGMPWAPAIMFCREVLGADRVLYAMDYPCEYKTDEVRAQDNLPLTEAQKKAVLPDNCRARIQP